LSRRPKERADVPEQDPHAIKEVLDAALPDQSPPTALHRDALIATGRRSLRRRRAAVVACAVVAAVLVAGGTATAGQYLPGRLARGHQLQPGGPRASASPSTSPSASPSPSATPEETARQRFTRLTAAFQPLLRRAVPGATWTANTNDPHLAENGVFAFTNAQGGARTDGDVHDATGTGEVWVDTRSWTPGTQPDTCDGSQTSRYSGGTARCESRTVGADTVVIYTDTAPNGALAYQLTTFRPADRTMVTIMTYNYGGSSVQMAKDAPTPEPQRPTPPLTVDTAIGIATAPGMRY
jgi:hypothetical protein